MQNDNYYKKLINISIFQKINPLQFCNYYKKLINISFFEKINLTQKYIIK